jgi:Putative Ig domain
MRKLSLPVFCFCAILFLFFSMRAHAASGVVIYPQNFVNFPNVPVGSSSPIPQTITVYNLSAASTTLSSISIAQPQFTLVSGTLPVTIPAGQYANLLVSFSPTSAKSYTVIMTFNFSGQPSLKETLFGIGTSTTAKTSLSSTSLNFGSQVLGTPAPPQTLTISNTGTSSFNVMAIAVTPPFVQTGFSGKSTTVKAGGSLSLKIYYYPWLMGPSHGSILITYNSLNSSGISLTGNANPASTFAISSFPSLPSATQNAGYIGQLTSTAGVGNVTWSLASGSTLPAGLSLSSTGAFSGTLASTVAVGSYTFTVQAMDSETPPLTATSTMTLPVGPPTGANCNNVTYDVNGVLTPITDLGTGNYQGYGGGLYANGSNEDDPVHDAYGVELSSEIQPLDANGNPSSSGKYVLLTVGQSNTQGVSYELENITSVDPSVNPNLVVVNGASGGASGGVLQDPNNYYWTVMTNNYLPNKGVTAKQVVAAWVNDVDAQGNPPTLKKLQSEY